MIFGKREPKIVPPRQDDKSKGFMSFKGGVGRTMLTIEIGVSEAFLRHSNVLFIDWDILNPRLTQRLFKKLPAVGVSLVKILAGDEREPEPAMVHIGDIEAHVIPAVTRDDIVKGTVDKALRRIYEKPDEVIGIAKRIIDKFSKEYDSLLNDYPAISWISEAMGFFLLNLIRSTSGRTFIIFDPSPWSLEIFESELFTKYLLEMKFLGVLINMVKPTDRDVTRVRNLFMPVCIRLKATVFGLIPFDPLFYEAGVGLNPSVPTCVSVSRYSPNSRASKIIHAMVAYLSERVSRSSTCNYIGP